MSDDQTEYQIIDRLSFMRFLGLSLLDRIPDAKTIWLFRENLGKNNGIRIGAVFKIKSLKYIKFLVNKQI